MIARKYGVVYTPDRLADFAAELLCAEIEKSEFDSVNVLDPACGECALLDSVKKIKRNEYEYIGIDVDKSAILSASSEYTIINNDTILPKNVRKRTAEFWTGKLPTINAVIANPPWSSEKIYNRDDLRKAGYELTAGQYDSFVLFLELAYKIVCENGIFAFIIPDSIFDSQNENLRRFLIRNTEIKVIARLGEKLFDEVNRAKHKVRIPSNLSILGTMNTSDQNVFTLDTAFQRRWEMRLIENNFEHVDRNLADAEILDTGITWEVFCTQINNIIVGNNARMTSAEDKRLGAYFVHLRDLKYKPEMGNLSDGEYDALRTKEQAKSITEAEKERLDAIRDAMKQNRKFPEKVIKYLWDDAFKFNREVVFETSQFQSLEQVIRTFMYAEKMDRFAMFKENVRAAFTNPEE